MLIVCHDDHVNPKIGGKLPSISVHTQGVLQVGEDPLDPLALISSRLLPLKGPLLTMACKQSKRFLSD